MAFLNLRSGSIYFSTDSTAKPIRPLRKEAVSLWVWKIPSCNGIGPDGKPITIRRFNMVAADFSQWPRNNQDPLWDQLDIQDKVDQNGNRIDFRLGPIHLLPIWSYTDNDVKMVKQGNQFFKGMEQFDESGGDVTTCDWMVWHSGQGRRKEYQTSRNDASQFQCPIDIQMLETKIQAVLEQAKSELFPFSSEEDFIKYLHGQSVVPSFAQSQQQQITQNIPSYTPGGQSQVQLGGVPALPPMQQSQPQNFNQQPVQAPPPSQYITQQPYQPQMQQSVQVPPQQTYQPQVQQPQVQQPQTQQTQTQQPVQAPPQQTYQPQAQQNQQQYQPQPINHAQTSWAPPTNNINQQQDQNNEENSIPNAPTTTQPVFAPPVTQQPQQTSQEQVDVITFNGNPADYVIDFGKKHKGKTLGQIKIEDESYLTYLKSNKKELLPLIDQVLSQPSNIQQQTAPQLPPNNQTIVQPELPMGDQEAMRSSLVKEINEKILTVPDFQGEGMIGNLMPFLIENVGGTNFSDASLDKLMVLKAKIDEKIAGA